jgi:hypothetical protein
MAIKAILEMRDYFYERSSTCINLEVDSNHLIEPCAVADEFDKNLLSLTNVACSPVARQGQRKKHL